MVIKTKTEYGPPGDSVVITDIVWDDCKEKKKGIVIIPATYNNLPITKIDSNAFSLIKSDIKEIYINAQIKSLESNLFVDACMLTKIILPETIENIGSCCFRRCYSLSSIDLPKGLKTIEEKAFMSSGIKQIKIPENVSLKSGVFQGCELLKDITWPKSITAIPSYMFLGCIRLQSFDFTDNIYEIGEKAFTSTYMQKADLSKTALQPNMVTNVFDKQTKIIFPYFCNAE